MKLEATIYCDGPECETHWRAGLSRFTADGRIDSFPPGFVQLRVFNDREDELLVFCGTDCTMKWCAKFDPPEVDSAWLI